MSKTIYSKADIILAVMFLGDEMRIYIYIAHLCVRAWRNVNKLSYQYRYGTKWTNDMTYFNFHFYVTYLLTYSWS
jgi:hypothetical protein